MPAKYQLWTNTPFFLESGRSLSAAPYLLIKNNISTPASFMLLIFFDY